MGFGQQQRSRISVGNHFDKYHHLPGQVLHSRQDQCKVRLRNIWPIQERRTYITFVKAWPLPSGIDESQPWPLIGWKENTVVALAELGAAVMASTTFSQVTSLASDWLLVTVSRSLIGSTGLYPTQVDTWAPGAEDRHSQRGQHTMGKYRTKILIPCKQNLNPSNQSSNSFISKSDLN